MHFINLFLVKWHVYDLKLLIIGLCDVIQLSGALIVLIDIIFLQRIMSQQF